MYYNIQILLLAMVLLVIDFYLELMNNNYVDNLRLSTVHHNIHKQTFYE